MYCFDHILLSVAAGSDIAAADCNARIILFKLGGLESARILEHAASI